MNKSLHQRINERMRVSVPGRVTVVMNDVYYTASIGDERLPVQLHKCVNQNGGPGDQELVPYSDLAKLHRLRREQVRLCRLHNPDWFTRSAYVQRGRRTLIP